MDDEKIIGPRYIEELRKDNEIPVKVLSPAVHEYKKEFEMQPVMDGQLPKFCKNRHCTERGPQCAKCAYTAMGPWR